MTDLPVLAAGQTRTLELDGTAYTVRALTYGEHTALQLARAAQPVPSTELINDALRQAAEAAGRPDLAEAITAQEEAEDALSALFASQPPALDAEGQARWLEEHAAELQSLRRAALGAARQRRLALERFGTAAPVADLRARAAEAMRAAALDLVTAGVVAIGGEPVRLTADQAADLPSAHIGALAEAISALLAPGADARKN